MKWFTWISAGLLLFGVSANAAVFQFGGEDTSFASQGSIGLSGNSATYDNNFARASISVGNSTTVADPPANRYTSSTFTSGTSVWFHAQFFASLTTTTSGEQAILFRSPDGVSRIVVRQTGTGGQLKVSKRDSGGTITDLATASSNYSATTITQLDIQVDYSATCTINVYYATVNVLTHSSSCRTDAATQLNQVEFASVNNGITGSVGCQGSGTATCWSEVIIADEDTRSMRLATLTLQAAGNTQGWTPNTLANVNKAAINDATFVSDVTGNVLSQWKTPTAAPTGSWGVRSVSIEARLLKSSTGPTQFDWSWRIGNTDYLAGMSNALTLSFANYRLQRDTSPATSTTWAIGEVYNTSTNQMNIGVKSLP